MHCLRAVVSVILIVVFNYATTPCFLANFDLKKFPSVSLPTPQAATRRAALVAAGEGLAATFGFGNVGGSALFAGIYGSSALVVLPSDVECLLVSCVAAGSSTLARTVVDWGFVQASDSLRFFDSAAHSLLSIFSERRELDATVLLPSEIDRGPAQEFSRRNLLPQELARRCGFPAR